MSIPQQSTVAKAFCEANCTMWKAKFGGCTANCDAKLNDREEGKCVWSAEEILRRRPDGMQQGRNS